MLSRFPFFSNIIKCKPVQNWGVIMDLGVLHSIDNNLISRVIAMGGNVAVFDVVQRPSNGGIRAMLCQKEIPCAEIEQILVLPATKASWLQGQFEEAEQHFGIETENLLLIHSECLNRKNYYKRRHDPKRPVLFKPDTQDITMELNHFIRQYQPAAIVSEKSSYSKN